MATLKKNVLEKTVFLLSVTIALLVLAVSTPLQAEEAEAPGSSETDGMEMPLDGSSLEAFEASLAEVKENSKASTYLTLENALDYLLVYDLEVQRSRAKLAAKLDGLTGYEVIDRVGWRKKGPRNRKVEEASSEAEVIDS